MHFKSLPRIIVVRLVITYVFYVNSFVLTDRVSKVLLPLTIMEGIVLNYRLHFRAICGGFFQTHEVTHNDITKRAINAFSLGTNGNLQGGIRCFSLETGRML